MLGLPVKDSTAGFRVFRRETLAAIPFNEVESHGYCFQVDMTLRAIRAGSKVVEVPITFVEREVGTSKMSQTIVAEALWKTTCWGLRHRLDQLLKSLKSRIA
jgi:dolichol-phosphate mannosyltransferase